MLYGTLAPTIEYLTNSFIFDSERCKTELEVSAKYTDNEAVDGTLHRDFLFNTVLKKDIKYKITYKINTKEESESLSLYDKLLINFYPHSDSLKNFTAWFDCKFSYENNKYFKDLLYAEISVVSENVIVIPTFNNDSYVTIGNFVSLPIENNDSYMTIGTSI